MEIEDSSENEINHKNIEDDEEDTLEEAPSIVDEALGKELSLPSSSRSSTGNSSSTLGSSRNWNKADNVRTTVGVDQKLKDSLYEGQEVAKILEEAKAQDEEEEEQPQPKKRNPLSHFKAMALVGKLFFDFKKLTPLKEIHPENDTATPTSKDETQSSSTPTSTPTHSKSTSSDRTPKVRIQRDESPSPGQASPEHDSFYSDGSSRDEILENEGSQVNELNIKNDQERSSSRRSSEVSSSSTSKLRSAAGNIKIMVEAEHKMKDMAEEGKEISNILTANAAEDESKEIEKDEKEGQESHSVSSNDSKNWSTEGNVRGDVTKDVTAEVEKSNEKGNDGDDKSCEIKKTTAPTMGGFKSHFRALGMLRLALAQRASKRSESSESSESEFSESSYSEGSSIQSQDATDANSNSGGNDSQTSLGNKTKSEKNESAKAVSKSNVSSAISPKSEKEGEVTIQDTQPSTNTAGQKDATKENSVELEEKILSVGEDILDATTVIQAGYRGMKAREELRGMKRHRDSFPNPPQIIIDSTAANSPSNSGTTDPSNASETGSNTSPGDNDDEQPIEMTDEVIDAATSILAAYRGRQARREVEKMKQEMALKFASEATDSEEESSDDGSEEESEEEETSEGENSVMQQPKDPKENEEIVNATTKIQSGYRGMKARKEVNKIKAEKEIDARKKGLEHEETNKNGPKPRPPQEIDETLNDVSSHELSSDGSNGTANNESFDIDLEEADIGGAVVTIQSGYRGYRGRKDLKARKEREAKAAVTIQSGARGHKARKEVKKKKQEQGEAAVAIQSGYRGYKTRKDRKEVKEKESSAAVVIQAGYRGHKTRKDVKQRKNRFRHIRN